MRRFLLKLLRFSFFSIFIAEATVRLFAPQH